MRSTDYFDTVDYTLEHTSSSTTRPSSSSFACVPSPHTHVPPRRSSRGEGATPVLQCGAHLEPLVRACLVVSILQRSPTRGLELWSSIDGGQVYSRALFPKQAMQTEERVPPPFSPLSNRLKLPHPSTVARARVCVCC